MVEGSLKLIDFGIAKAIGGDTTSIARESQVVRAGWVLLLVVVWWVWGWFWVWGRWTFAPCVLHARTTHTH
jgi:hypothetical protein